MSDPCFNPRVFMPASGPLLSLAQWQGLQAFLINASQLDAQSVRNQIPMAAARAASVSGNPEPNGGFQHSVDPVYLMQKEVSLLQTLKDDALQFKTTVLPLAQKMGRSVAGYCQTVDQTFLRIVELLGVQEPDAHAILGDLEGLQSQATTYMADARELFGEVAAYIDRVSASAAALQQLSSLVASVDNPNPADPLSILGSAYMKLANTKQQKEEAILQDPHAVTSAKYFTHLDGVGTVVTVDAAQTQAAVMAAQVAVIAQQMQTLHAQMYAIHPLFSTLAYIKSFNGALLAQLGNTKSALQLFANAWHTIQAELQIFITDATAAGQSQLKNQPCLAAVQLTTAAGEWQEVAGGALNFVNNFYLKTVGS